MMQMAAWWIPAEGPDPAERCAVLIHSYADAKVGALAWNADVGINSLQPLIPDLRGIAESDGKYFTGGWFERHDLVQMINRVQTRNGPIDTRQIILFRRQVSEPPSPWPRPRPWTPAGSRRWYLYADI